MRSSCDVWLTGESFRQWRKKKWAKICFLNHEAHNAFVVFDRLLQKPHHVAATPRKWIREKFHARCVNFYDDETRVCFNHRLAKVRRVKREQCGDLLLYGAETVKPTEWSMKDAFVQSQSSWLWIECHSRRVHGKHLHFIKAFESDGGEIAQQ